MEFRDLKKQYIHNKDAIDTAIQSVLDSGQFIGGNHVSKLEQQLADYIGTKHCITCANGTDALSLVLMAWEIKKGDAVFVPNFTFFSTGEVVSFNGATPIFVDVDSRTFNMDPIKLEEAIAVVKSEGSLTPKVIIPVDLFGLPADYKSIESIAQKHDLLVLEDGAQGFGGQIDGKMACSFGDAATTSFFPAKPLGCYGDGGAIFTNSDQTAELLRSLKIHGKGINKYDNIRIGLNSRLDSIQAAVLTVKLTVFKNEELNAVNTFSNLYTEMLGNEIETPYIPKGYYSSFAQYTIKLENEVQRDALKAYLTSVGIPSVVYYIKPMHKQLAFKDELNFGFNYEVTDSLCKTVLSLPMHPYLEEDEIYKVCKAIKNFVKSNY